MDVHSVTEYRKTESDICLRGDKIANNTHIFQHPKLHMLVTSPLPQATKDLLHVYIYIYIHVSPVIHYILCIAC